MRALLPKRNVQILFDTVTGSLKKSILIYWPPSKSKNDTNIKKKHHPIRPRRGEVYLTQLGQNIGKEINNQHLAVILQNNKANIFSNTVVIIPISSSVKLYDGHEKIEEYDIKSGRLDKLPSKVKTEQIQFIDKARLIHKVAEFTEDTMDRISCRLKKTLDLKYV